MRAPVLAMGDGALAFWKAQREVFPGTKEQRCWWHKLGNILAALPRSAHPGARAALAEVYNAEDNDHAIKAAKTFAADYGAMWPEHRIHLRTTNPIKSTFATVRLRQRVTKGPGCRAAGIAMASSSSSPHRPGGARSTPPSRRPRPRRRRVQNGKLVE